MSYNNIIYQVEDGIARITLNRPKALNSLNPDMISETKAAVEDAGKDDDVGVIVITGAGRAFCAGVDLKSLESPKGADVGPELNNAARDLQTAIEIVPKVVIGMVNGFCLTGGLEIMLACDLVVASDEAKFGDTHVRWGLRCTWGMSRRLPQRVGELKAREMTYTAEMISSVEAERIGLINKMVPASQLEETVKELAGKILGNSRDAVAAHKYLYTSSKKDEMEKGLEREYTTMPEIGDTLERLTGFAK
ncbi:MAG: enoyl-CoA hydratase/isomerase family protein [Proteobacteria bacterium]|nr:enoyl-CoA hydratase/isomerase family protein [Pseudomonadota bacterium]